MTTGEGFPGEKAGRPPASVLYLASGEDPDFVIRSRVERSGGELKRLYFLDVGETVVLPNDAPRIIRAAQDVSAGMIILDAAFSFVDPKLEIFHDRELRVALELFARALAEAGLVGLGVRHFTKMKRGPMQQGMGAVAGAAVARAILLLNPNPTADQDRGRLLSCAKLSYGALPTSSLCFRVESEGPLGLAWLAFTGESSIGSREAVNAGRDEDAADRTASFAQMVATFRVAGAR